MTDLYEALEICLQDIEQGADVETVIFRYPDLAEELRPILEASAGAKSMAVAAPAPDVVRRSRAKVMQQAARMRESKAKPSQRGWFVLLRRVAVTLAVVAVLFVSGTGLVGASSNTLPGDNLYPVKRTWEGLQLFLTFNGPERAALELEHDNERLYEVQALLQDGRSDEVDFKGRLTSQQGNEWVVSGFRVMISSQTDLRDPGITVGSVVRVRGLTQQNGTVLAERIDLLSSDASLPDVEDEHESEEGNENNSGPGSGEEQPEVEETEMPELENENENSGSGSGSNSNENLNSNENSNGNENSHSSENSNENESGNENNSGSNENEEESNENSNESGEEENESNENENESGGGENSGSGGGGNEEGGGEED